MSKCSATCLGNCSCSIPSCSLIDWLVSTYQKSAIILDTNWSSYPVDWIKSIHNILDQKFNTMMLYCIETTQWEQQTKVLILLWTEISYLVRSILIALFPHVFSATDKVYNEIYPPKKQIQTNKQIDRTDKNKNAPNHKKVIFCRIYTEDTIWLLLRWHLQERATSLVSLTS